MSKPIVYDLYSGLHGWLEAFLLEGYRCVAFDIVDMCAEIGHPRPEGIELRIRDVRSIHGSELKDAAVIVGSSPCQEFSYRAMPWKRAKALPPPYLGMELFNAQFRIQREASEAAGHYIPMVVENVRGAQKWVGRAQWNYGSFYLWGDVPALMPLTFKAQKGVGIGSVPWGQGKGQRHPNDPRNFYSKSSKRKAASAMIAKIPYPLAQHIARCYYP